MPATKTQKKAFMLHSASGQPLGKYMSNTSRQAALKAASKGYTDVILRQTSTKICKQFQCKYQELAEPRVIKRGDKEIKYSKVPEAKLLRTFIADFKVDENEDVEGVDAPPSLREPKPRAKRTKKKVEEPEE